MFALSRSFSFALYRSNPHLPAHSVPLTSTLNTSGSGRQLLEHNYFTEMCSRFEAGSYLRLIDCVYHSALGLGVIKKKKKKKGTLASHCSPDVRHAYLTQALSQSLSLSLSLPLPLSLAPSLSRALSLSLSLAHSLSLSRMSTAIS